MRKKALGATVLLAIISGGVSAQSSVVLYGLLDAYATRFKGVPGGANASDKYTKRLESSGMTRSNLSFRATEDLGDGLYAAIELDTFIRVDTGASGRSDAVGTVTADPFWSKESSIALGTKALGRIRFGNFSTPMFAQSLSNTAFGSSTVFSPINILTFITSPLSGGTGWTNQIAYDSANFYGLTVAAAVSASEGQNGRNVGGKVAYASGPVAVSFAGQNVKKNPLTFADGTSPNNTKAWQAAASYDFNFVKIYGVYGQIQNDGTEAAPLDVRYRLWDLSASVPIGNGNLLAAYGIRKTGDKVALVAATAAGGNVNRKVGSIAYDYFLSKRTDIYAVLMHDKTSTNTLPAPGRLLDATATNFALGMRHRF